MNAIFAGMYTTRQLVIPTTVSNQEQPLKTFQKIGYALSAGLLSLTFHRATNKGCGLQDGDGLAFPVF